MKFAMGLLAAVLLLAGANASHAAIRIADDRGGRIGTYIDKYEGLRSSGETVIIDGLCASACTIVLGAVPHDRICVTAHANLGFHAAWDFGADGRAVTNPDATQLLYALYPSPVRRWITARGGLKPQMVFLHARGACPYDVCRSDPYLRERELLFWREADDLDPAIHRLETVDVLLRTQPADRNFQSHKICDATDKRRAIGYFGAPDR